MTTQYTSILKLALPVQGELSGTWGDTVNDNITSMVEEAIAGRSVINSWTANSHTLTTADGTTSESRAAMLEFTDTGAALTGNATVVCPTASKIYIAKNAVGSSRTVTLKTSAGTGIAIPDGTTMFLFCDGTNVVEAVTNINSFNVGGTVAINAIKDEDNMASDSATALATQQSIKAYVDSQVGSFDTLAEVLAQGNTSGGTGLIMSSGDDLTLTGASYNAVWDSSDSALEFGDNAKAVFGAGSDLQIYHNGSHSFINDTGTGDLRVLAANFAVYDAAGTNLRIKAFDSGATKLYDGTTGEKLATTSTGIDVTGTAVTDGLTVAGTAQFDDYGGTTGKGRIQFGNSGQQFVEGLDTGNGGSGAYLRFGYGSTETMRIDNSGQVGIGNTSPEQPVTVGTTSDSQNYIQIKTSTTGAAGLLFSDGTSSNPAGYLYDHTSDFASIKVNGSERMRIDSSGNVGIGTSTVSTSKLHVQGTTGTASAVRVESTAADSDAYYIADNDGSVWTWGIDGGVSDAWILSNAFGLGTPAITVGTTGNITQTNTSAGSGEGPLYNLYRNSASPADNDDLGVINFKGKNDAAEDVIYATIESQALDVTDATEDGRLFFTTIVGGTKRSRIDLRGTETVINEGSLDLDFRVESDGNANMLFVDAGNDRVGIGTASPGTTLDVAGTVTADGLDVEIADNAASPVTIQQGGNSYFKIVTTNSSESVQLGNSTTNPDILLGGGNVGIGTTSPTEPLTVSETASGSTTQIVSLVNPVGAASTGVRLWMSGTNTTTRGTFIDAVAESTSNDHTLRFGTSAASSTPTERMRIDSNGKLLIGDSASHTSDLLQIETPASGGGHGIQIRRNDANGDQGIGTITFGNNTDTDLAQIKAKTDGDGNSGDSGALLFSTQVTSGSLTERMRIDSVGNVGVGLTPFGWSSYKSIGVNGSGAHYGTAAGSTLSGISHGCYYDGSNWKYAYTGAGATRYEAVGSTSPYQAWYTANSGTADATITFAEAMRINSDGDLLIGRTTTPPTAGAKLAVLGTGDTAIQVTKSGVIAGRISAVTTAIAFGVDGSDGATERMRIDSSGNVQIGNATYGSSLGQLRVINDATSAPASLSLMGYGNVTDNAEVGKLEFALQQSGTGGQVHAKISGLASGTGEDEGQLAFYTSDNTLTERMRIDENGNVGIATDSPADLLHIEDSSAVVSTTQLTLEGRYNGYGAGIDFVSRTSSGGTRLSMAKITADGENSWNTTASTQDSALLFFTTLDGVQSEALRINSAGNIKFDTSSSAIENGTGELYLIGATNIRNQAAIHTFSNSAGTSEYARINSSGQMVFGDATAYAAGAVTIAPSATDSNLALYGSSTSYGGRLFFGDSSDRCSIRGYYGTGGGGFLDFRTDTTGGTDLLAMRLDNSQDLFLFNQSSGAGNADLRYSTSTGQVTYDTSSRLVKDQIEDIPYGLTEVLALSPKKYVRTDTGNPVEIGFIADEVVDHIPDVVGMMEKRFLTEVETDTEIVPGSVSYGKLTAVLVKAIQEQQDLIESLTARIAALEGAN